MNADPPRHRQARIEYLKVQNFRALREVEFKGLTPLTVLLGPNGSGKSTVFDVFAFLAECFELGLRRAWDKRGRAKELKTRGGDGPVSMIVRAILGVIWFPVSYLTRAYFVVLIEPGFNPIKAPMSYLAAKFMWPFIPVLTSWGTGLLAPVMGDYLAVAFCASTVWLLPDAFGFLFWEMKENWSLYRANRPARLKPVVLGPHGETMLQLLCPGFHSGTLPKLYARLRAAERTAYASGSWRRPGTTRCSSGCRTPSGPSSTTS